MFLNPLVSPLRCLMGLGRPRGAAPKLCRTGSEYLNLATARHGWKATNRRLVGGIPTPLKNISPLG